MTGVIVHEWLARAGGSENVVDAMAAQFADADVLCLWNDDPARFAGGRVRETRLASTPLRGRKALSLPAMPFIWRNLPGGEDYDWILASSHVFAHQARFPARPDLPKFVYVHTPARYIWTPELDPRGANPFVKATAPLFRAVDRRFAQDPSLLAANSDYIRERIAAAWHRDSVVIHPPVEVSRIRSEKDWTSRLMGFEQSIVEALPETFILGASRFVSYKRLDSVITVGEACGIPVVLAGSGPEEAALRELALSASVPVIFIDRPSDALLYVLYRRALVYVFPPVEDFGIMPVEAMAAGARVIVNTVGGARESVVAGVTGAHLAEFSGSDAREAVEAAAMLCRDASVQRSESFSAEKFARSLDSWMFGNRVAAAPRDVA